MYKLVQINDDGVICATHLGTMNLAGVHREMKIRLKEHGNKTFMFDVHTVNDKQSMFDLDDFIDFCQSNCNETLYIELAGDEKYSCFTIDKVE